MLDETDYFISYRGTIPEEVIDPNGHMNVSGFDRLFDTAENALFDALDLSWSYVKRTRMSLFRLEKFVRYETELLVGQEIETRSRILGTDGRKLHHFHEIMNLASGRRAAVFDCLALHVSLDERRARPLPEGPERTALLRAIAAHGAGGRPPGALERFAEGQMR